VDKSRPFNVRANAIIGVGWVVVGAWTYAYIPWVGLTQMALGVCLLIIVRVKARKAATPEE
jgi:hypothetical protein